MFFFKSPVWGESQERGSWAGPAEVEEQGRRNEHGRGLKGGRLRPEWEMIFSVIS